MLDKLLCNCMQTDSGSELQTSLTSPTLRHKVVPDKRYDSLRTRRMWMAVLAADGQCFESKNHTLLSVGTAVLCVRRYQVSFVPHRAAQVCETANCPATAQLRSNASRCITCSQHVQLYIYGGPHHLSSLSSAAFVLLPTISSGMWTRMQNGETHFTVVSATTLFRNVTAND